MKTKMPENFKQEKAGANPEGLDFKQTSWNLSDLASGDEDSKFADKRKAIEENTAALVKKWKERGDYLENPAILKEALDDYESWRRSFAGAGDEGYYFTLRTTLDEDNPDLQGKYNKMEEFKNKIGNKMTFFPLNVAKIPAAKQKEFLADDSLSAYRHFLERIFAGARHLLSEAEEKIMNLKEAGAHNKWVNMVSAFLSKEQREVLDEDGRSVRKNLPEILGLINNADKKVRDTAAAALDDIFKKNIDLAEREMNAILANKKVDDELRGYDRPDASRHLEDDIDGSTIDALLAAVSGRNDLAQRFYAFKAELMGVEKLAYHERNVPYGKLNKKYSFPEAAAMVYKVLGNLDPEFGEIFKGFLNNGQIDAFPRTGKTGGAACFDHLIGQRTYIILNHNDEISDVRTLAHETGHGINNELMKKRQNSLNYGTSTATAEVASTFMEDFVIEELMKEADDELKLALLTAKVEDSVTSIFRQVAFYQFEQDLHREFRDAGYLSREKIGELFQKRMADYMGEAVEQSEGSENWWIYVSHFRNFFYTYSYASGLLISKSLQNEAKKDPRFVGAVKEFLAAGLSDYPKNIFQRLGLDISDKEFWNKGLNEIEGLLQEAEVLAKKLGKI